MERNMSTTPDTEKVLRQLTEDLCARASTVDRGSVEDRAGMLSALSEITVQAKYAGLTSVVEASRALSVIVDGAGADDPATMAAGLATLQASLQGGAAFSLESAAPSGLAQHVTAQHVTAQQAAPAPTPQEDSAASQPWAADPELLSEFFAEAADHLTTIETQLLKLEHDPAGRESIDAIFRGFHTIKGLAGFLTFPAMQAVAHETETLLDSVRNGTLAVTPEVIDVVLESADYLRRDLARLQEAAGGAPLRPAADNTALIGKVRSRMSGGAAAAAPAPAAAAEIRGEAPDGAAGAREPRKPAAAESRLIRVDTAKLDFLVDMVGELVISQSLIRHDGGLNATANPKLQGNLSQLARITADVQKTAMSMRMVPVGQLFQK
jgi:two-component system chemotaxis sensor kinase CheA